MRCGVAADVPELTNISPQNRMDIWVIEHRLRAERIVTSRLTQATWVLVGVTVALVIATAALVLVGYEEGREKTNHPPNGFFGAPAIAPRIS
jgi:hypothetical protein